MAYRSKVTDTNVQSKTENRSNDERLSIVFPKPQPFPFPFPPPRWPWPFPGPTFPEGGERDIAEAATLQAISDPELLKRLYCKPEYRAVIQLYGSALLKRFEADPEALRAFKDLLKAQGLELDQQERVVPIIIAAAVAASFFGGCVLGYKAEQGKARQQ